MSDAASTIKGYHGTDAALKDKIIREGFKPTLEREWLGEGVYFFVDGVSSGGPENDAINWAESRVKCHGATFRCWAVMTAEITTQNMLDLTDQSQLRYFNEFRSAVYSKALFRSRNSDDQLLDIEILEEILKEAPQIEVVKSNFFIKFTVENQRKIGSRIPNVTIVCVSKPEKAIVSGSIRFKSSATIRR